ncbi:MAG: histidinol-phosphatase HisJ family protein [Lachnospiraceae bacterium]|nr:histidinol-phosphatase HisJ family protein [Lachnospiraceae bacterium]
MIADFHIHTCFSGDSEANVDAVIQSAISKGMKHMAITDHNDFQFENGLFELDIEKYFDYMTKKKAEYKDQISLSVGIECGLEPKYAQRINSLVNSYDFDFIIGSSHVINGRDPYYKEYFENRPVHDAMVEYLESIIENITVFDNFDVYGHLDYMMRYAPVSPSEKRYDYNEYGELFDTILTKLISKGKGIEINTSPLRCGLADTNPNIQVIKRYKELGGKIITVGSDSHIPEDLGANFDDAVNILKEAGFSYYNIFSSRKASEIVF